MSTQHSIGYGMRACSKLPHILFYFEKKELNRLRENSLAAAALVNIACSCHYSCHLGKGGGGGEKKHVFLTKIYRQAIYVAKKAILACALILARRRSEEIDLNVSSQFSRVVRPFVHLKQQRSVQHSKYNLRHFSTSI